MIDDLASPEATNRGVELLAEFFKSKTSKVQFPIENIFVECSR